MSSIETPKDNQVSPEGRTAKLFRNGRSQAVRLPKEYELDAEEVLIRKEAKDLILTPRPRSWDEYFARASQHIDFRYRVGRALAWRQEKRPKAKQ